ncbi:hypothetical protein AB205_0154800 [Aquarana catesbeiana]|uniref:Uncharacterized protein n=1 Tax=Aquarana catesbeiana TaxID=8400 RepID=A0A2G9QLZ4_AQUCT|nr:hypothetical protein AB205_0154800 [Aquarana catesbeiana]
MGVSHLPQTGQLPVFVYEQGEEIVVVEPIHFLCKTQHKTNPKVRPNSPNLVTIKGSISKQYRPKFRSYLRYHDRRIRCSFLRSQIVRNTQACYALYTLRMRVTPPAPDVLSSLFSTPFRSAQWGKSTWRRHSRCVLIIATRRRRRKCRSLKRLDPEGDDLRHQICPLGRCWRWWTF